MVKRTTKKKKKEEEVALVKLDLGCGQNKREGFQGVDIVPGPGVDFVHDLTVVPWPFKDESVDELHSAHFIEHLTGDQFILFMEEAERVLKPTGKMTLIAPYYTSARCWQDPTHKQAIMEQKFLYFNKGWREANRLSHYPIKCNFNFTFAYSISDPRWSTAADEPRAFAMKHYWNVIDDLIVNLERA